MAKISISLPDELLNYIDQKVDNRSALIESLLKQWQEQKQNEALLAVYEFVGSSTKPMMVCAFFPLAFIHVHAKNYQMHGSSYVGIDDCRVSDLCWPV